MHNNCIHTSFNNICIIRCIVTCTQWSVNFTCAYYKAHIYCFQNNQFQNQRYAIGNNKNNTELLKSLVYLHDLKLLHGNNIQNTLTFLSIPTHNASHKYTAFLVIKYLIWFTVSVIRLVVVLGVVCRYLYIIRYYYTIYHI